MVEFRACIRWVAWFAALAAAAAAWAAEVADPAALVDPDRSLALVTPAVAVVLVCWWWGWRGLATAAPALATGVLLHAVGGAEPSPSSAMSPSRWAALIAVQLVAYGTAGLVLRRIRVDLFRPRATDTIRFLAVGVLAAPLVAAAASAVILVDRSSIDRWAVARTFALVDMAAVAVVVPFAALVRGLHRRRRSPLSSVARARRLRRAVRGVLAMFAVIASITAVSLGDTRVDALFGAVVLLSLAAAGEERRRSDAHTARAIAELDIDRARLWSLVDDADDGVLLLDARGHVESANAAAARLFDVEPDALRGRSVLELVPVPEGSDTASHLVALLSSRREDPGSVGHTWEARRDSGESFPLDLSVRRVASGEHWGYVATVRDDTNRRRREQQLAHRATHDELTQLPNRVLFQDRLEQALHALEGRPSGLALLLVGVQRRAIDRALGRIAGDRVVAEVARRLTECVRDTDTVARIGDDELAVVVQPCAGPATAGQLATRLLAHVTRPLYGLPAELVPRARIGVVTTSDPHARPDRLLAEADVALERARSQPSPGWCIYRPTIDVRELNLLEIDLRDHLRDRVVLHYQPVLDVKTGRVDAVEALARLRTHDSTLMSPNEFVPFAERNDLAERLGEAVLAQAARDLLVLRQEEGFEDLRVAVNVSPHQLTDALHRVVVDTLAEFVLPPSAVILEITESAPIDLRPGALDVLRQLQKLGVGIALDDIGTGFSRLDQVRDLPADALKIDRSFVQRVVDSPIDRDIVEMIVAVGRRRGLAVIAEGVETVEQADALTRLGCTHVQGYLFGQPMQVEELRYVLREWHVVPAFATNPADAGRVTRRESPRITPG